MIYSLDRGEIFRNLFMNILKKSCIITGVHYQYSLGKYCAKHCLRNFQQYPALKMTWRNEIKDADVIYSFGEIINALAKTDQPIFMIVDLTANPTYLYSQLCMKRCLHIAMTW
jgi:hypothetical protein